MSRNEAASKKLPMNSNNVANVKHNVAHNVAHNGREMFEIRLSDIDTSEGLFDGIVESLVLRVVVVQTEAS